VLGSIRIRGSCLAGSNRTPSTGETALVRFENVRLSYGSGPPVLDDLSFHLDPGSFHFILGASGAGKSSLLQLMYLWQRPTHGRISLFGRDVRQLSRHDKALVRRRIGVVFQDFRLLDHLTTLENVALPLRVAGRHRPSLDEHAAELLSWVGLGDHLHHYPPTLSGGQQQRVAIARAVIARPSLLLADEPTGNVDDRLALRLLYLFEELNKMGTTVVIATHNETLAERFRQPMIRLTGGDAPLPSDRRKPAKARQ
jgi:cell division transport system ATP-binding protein